jgi:hypothetical protein
MSLMIQNILPTESELNSYKIIAQVAASNPHWRKVGGLGDEKSIVATILSVMLLARELGVSPIQSISGGIANIQGKFEISARLMNQLIRKHGHQIAIVLSNEQICKIWTKRKDTGEEHEESYHIEEAARAGLIKDGGGWKKNPKDMLFARCISRLARRVYPDCLGGCYVEGELQETIQGKVVEAPELPEMDCIEAKEEEVVLNLPEGVPCDLISIFANECANHAQTSVEKIKARANQNMDKFIATFHAWKNKRDLELQIAS